jgi:hypothetical protein
MTDQEDGAVTRVEAHLVDGGGEIFGDVVVDVADGARAEVPRASVAPEIEVEDVVAGAGEMVRDAPCREVPRVAVLPEAVDEQHRRPRSALVAGETLPHHREGDLPARDDQLLHERRAVVPVDRLLEGTAVENHVFNGENIRDLSEMPTLSVASFLASRPKPRRV